MRSAIQWSLPSAVVVLACGTLFFSACTEGEIVDSCDAPGTCLGQEEPGPVESPTPLDPEPVFPYVPGPTEDPPIIEDPGVVDPPPGNNDPVDAGSQLPPGPGDVTGACALVKYAPAGVGSLPCDLSTIAIRAWTKDADGGFTEYPGSGRADGKLVVRGVPEGPYVLQYGGIYLSTNSRTVDLSTAGFGTTDRPRLTSRTMVSLRNTGLTPWVAGDSLEMVSFESSSWTNFSGSTGMPAAKATSLTTHSYDYFTATFPRPIQNSLGEKAWLVHMTQRTSAAGLTYRVSSQVVSPKIELVNGVASTLTGAFAANPILSKPVTFKLSAWNALRAQVYPTAVLAGPHVSVRANPPGVQLVHNNGSAILNYASPTGVADVVFSAMAYGRPYQTTWDVYGTGYGYFDAVLDGPTPITGRAYWSVINPIAEFGPTVQPEGGPPRNVSINGLPAYKGTAGAGESPVFRWDPPATGAPYIYVLSVMNGTTVVARIHVPVEETSFALPPGLLKAGVGYYVRVSAVYSPVDTFQPLFPSVSSRGAFEALSGSFTP